MGWIVEYSDRADAQIRGLDRQTGRRIIDYMDRVGLLQDPRQRGQALSGTWAGHWRYRVGDYRVICEIQDEVLQVLVVRVGHRGQIYR